MTKPQASETGSHLTLEEFWDSFTTWHAASKARQDRIDEQLAELAKSGAKSGARIDEQLDKLAKNVGGLGNSIGELIETLIAARLWEKFSEYPYNLKRAYQRVPVFNERHQIVTDIDILLSDSEWVMAVEVKRELKRHDEVDNHVKRMGRIRKYPPSETVGKRLVGAMAGGVVDPEVRDHAHAAGFFVLELTGENVCLVKPSVEFSPGEW
jgi:hypothetical protein